MEIVITKNSIDLGDPVCMTEEKRKLFIEKLRELYGTVEEVKVTEPKGPPIGKSTGERWKAEELSVLFDEKLSIKAMAAKLGKDPMSIQMQMGETVPKILMWMRDKKGISIIPTKEDIEQYLNEKGSR